MAGWRADARYTRMIEKNGRSLMHFAILLTGNHSDAEDVVQDALIAVAATWTPAHPVSYLRRAVANKAIDLIRRRRDIPTAEMPETLIEERGFLRHEGDEAFFALLRTLPEGQRTILVLRYHADMGDRAIAALLEISAATVRSQAHRALEKLRALDLVKEDDR